MVTSTSLQFLCLTLVFGFATGGAVSKKAFQSLRRKTMTRAGPRSRRSHQAKEATTSALRKRRQRRTSDQTGQGELAPDTLDFVDFGPSIGGGGDDPDALDFAGFGPDSGGVDDDNDDMIFEWAGDYVAYPEGYNETASSSSSGTTGASGVEFGEFPDFLVGAEAPTSQENETEPPTRAPTTWPPRLWNKEAPTASSTKAPSKWKGGGGGTWTKAPTTQTNEAASPSAAESNAPTPSVAEDDSVSETSPPVNQEASSPTSSPSRTTENAPTDVASDVPEPTTRTAEPTLAPVTEPEREKIDKQEEEDASVSSGTGPDSDSAKPRGYLSNLARGLIIGTGCAFCLVLLAIFCYRSRRKLAAEKECDEQQPSRPDIEANDTGSSSDESNPPGPSDELSSELELSGVSSGGSVRNDDDTQSTVTAETINDSDSSKVEVVYGV